MTGIYTAEVGSRWIGWRGCFAESSFAGAAGEVGEGVFGMRYVFGAGDAGDAGDGVLAMTHRLALNISDKYNVFHVQDRPVRAFPILSLYIYYFLFFFLQSRRGEKTLTSLSGTKRASKTGNKEEEGS